MKHLRLNSDVLKKSEFQRYCESDVQTLYEVAKFGYGLGAVYTWENVPIKLVKPKQYIDTYLIYLNDLYPVDILKLSDKLNFVVGGRNQGKSFVHDRIIKIMKESGINV